MNKLWTRDFTIITLGTVVSMLGNAVSGFAIGLMVLDYSESVFLYALFMVIYNLPKIVMPLIAGPLLDNFSRKKTIYTLDFISTGIFVLLFLIMRFDLFNYIFLLIMSFVIGTIDSIYQVAYESLYPTLISEVNYRKAYSISSVIFPISAIMMPVAAFMYKSVGLEPLFLFNAATFLIAAIFETQIKAEEKYVKKDDAKYGLREFAANFKEGIKYISGEKGLLVITAYFVVTMFAGGAGSTVILPYFKSLPGDGVMLYTIVNGAAVIGRLAGGVIHYKFKYPTDKKFFIAICVYFCVTAIDGIHLFVPFVLMAVLMFLYGILGVTSYNIRISATQSYVPDDHRARFNGTFQMLCTFGSILGQLIAGALADFIPYRAVVVVFAVINVLAVFLIMFRGKEHVKPIYNREV